MACERTLTTGSSLWRALQSPEQPTPVGKGVCQRWGRSLGPAPLLSPIALSHQHCVLLQCESLTFQCASPQDGGSYPRVCFIHPSNIRLLGNLRGDPLRGQRLMASEGTKVDVHWPQMAPTIQNFSSLTYFCVHY